MSPEPAVELEHHNNSDYNPLMDLMQVHEAAMGSGTQLAFPSAHHQADVMAAESGDQVCVPMNCIPYIHWHKSYSHVLSMM